MKHKMKINPKRYRNVQAVDDEGVKVEEVKRALQNRGKIDRTR